MKVIYKFIENQINYYWVNTIEIFIYKNEQTRRKKANHIK